MSQEINEELISKLISAIEEEERHNYVNIKDKTDMVNLCYDYLVKHTSGANIKKVLNAPFKSMGYISLTGREISFDSPDVMVAVSSAASNVDVYPKLNGHVEIDFTFHGIAKRINA